MTTMLAASGSAFDAFKSVVNALCEPHWFLIISVVGMAVFLIG